MDASDVLPRPEVAHQLTLTHEGVEGSGAQRHLGSALLLVGDRGYDTGAQVR
jgi:hypothetical protein